MQDTPRKPRSEGVTDAERYLKRLCDRSFLSMWSFTGVFNDRNTGQEVCDLLVVFGNHIIIFSDKDCEFPDSDNLEHDWKKWFRKTIKKSADQVYGAERWIRSNPERLFLDQACKIPFPIELPTSEAMIFHRVVVAHSGSARCAELLGGSGSLLIDNQVVGDAKPFTIGRIDDRRDYVHVLDDTTLDILLQTLDTISDFVAYLSKKEKFLTQKLKIWAAGEEELLAIYLKNLNDDDEHDFVFDRDIGSLGGIGIGEGMWTEFSSNLQRKAQISANTSSYFWDWLIENFTNHFFNGTSYYNSHSDVVNQEKLLRLLAKENRTRRRFLSNAFFEFVRRTDPSLKASRMLSGEADEPYYVFLVVPEREDTPYDRYREIRRELLTQHCLIAKLTFPNASDIIGIATESGRKNGGSEDLIYLDARHWTAKNQKEAESVRSQLVRAKLFTSQHRFEKTEYEYPLLNQPLVPVHTTTIKGKHKNKPCVCGSGKKTKKCCGA